MRRVVVDVGRQAPTVLYELSSSARGDHRHAFFSGLNRPIHRRLYRRRVVERIQHCRLVPNCIDESVRDAEAQAVDVNVRPGETPQGPRACYLRLISSVLHATDGEDMVGANTSVPESLIALVVRRLKRE